jgi:hypothetical protein
VPGGLQVAQDGYRLSPVTTRLSADAAQPFRFRVLGPEGKPVTEHTGNHEKDLHLILVRRDMSGYQHVHPVPGPRWRSRRSSWSPAVSGCAASSRFAEPTSGAGAVFMSCSDRHRIVS